MESIHITWNLYITTSLNEIQAKAHGQGTRQQFHLKLIWDKYKPLPQ